jgi:PAS domain S-box-containing protein
MINGADLLAALPVAVYMTDADGHIIYYNDAAAELWGQRPEIGSSKFSGAWRLYLPDGRELAYDESPTAIALREKRTVRDIQIITERPDGTRVLVLPYPTLLRDEAGEVTGTVNLMVDISDRNNAKIDLERLAAIVSSSDDAIISKTLEGRITSWNSGATRIFGYEASEMVGRPILTIVPPELHHEEATILSRLRRGERIDHFDTVRVAKDGRLVEISLTVSPLRDALGRVVGASKVARDVTERKRSEDLQRLLFEELNHRVKNTLATIQAIASQSLRRSPGPEQFVTSFNGRVQALGRAHDLLVRGKMQGTDVEKLVQEQVVLGPSEGTRVSLSGPFVKLDSRVAVQLALVLHELATNARKYGALSVPGGLLSIRWRLHTGPGRQLVLDWKESGVGGVRAPTSRGFGTTLIERSFEANGGQAVIRYGGDGLVCEMRLPLPEIEESAANRILHGMSKDVASVSGASRLTDIRGKRVLLVEDEPLIAMEVESQLLQAGCEVVGPAATVERAKALIAEATFDTALIDANLDGNPVDEIAAALTQKGIPFAFATGYGRDALPLPFRDGHLLSKPFDPEQVIAMVQKLLSQRRSPATVVPLSSHAASF